ncbi:MAG: hypothetical protein ABSA39_15445 [Edaphobacter sp.]
MMSAAILVPMSAEQTSLPPASSDMSSHAGQEDLSFAKKFSERVGDPVMLGVKTSAVEPAIPPVAVKRTEAAKSGVTASIGGEKQRISAGQEISAQGELQNAVARRIVQSETTAVAGTRAKMAGGDSTTVKEAMPSPQAEASRKEVVAALPKPEALPVAVPRGNEPVQPAVAPDGDALLTSGGNGPVVSNQTAAAEEKTNDVIPEKKAAKPEVSAVTAKSVQKPVRTAVIGAVKEGTSTSGMSTESLMPMVGQGDTAVIVPGSESGKASVEVSKTDSEVATIRAGVAPAAVDGSVRNGNEYRAKADVAVDAESPVSVADDPKTIEKPDVDMEKMTAVAGPSALGNETKAQDGPDAAATVVHAMSGGAEASLGFAPGVIAPGEVRDVTSTKLAVSDAGAHPAGVLAESREQDGSGGVATSMDGMPRMLVATPTTLEVGIANGTHGWLKVRAEMVDGGEIHASVSTASPAGLEILHRELPSLTTYLQQEKVAVNTVAIHTAAVEPVERRGSSADMGGAGQTPQNGEGRERPQSSGRVTAGRDGEAVGYQEDDADGLSPLAIFGGGSWLSVRA